MGATCSAAQSQERGGWAPEQGQWGRCAIRDEEGQREAGTRDPPRPEALFPAQSPAYSRQPALAQQTLSIALFSKGNCK